jgi:hypothetical protein
LEKMWAIACAVFLEKEIKECFRESYTI